MRFLSRPDASVERLATPVLGGEYSNFGENFSAAYDATTSLSNFNSAGQLISKQIDPMIQEIKAINGWQDYELYNAMSEHKSSRLGSTDEDGNPQTQYHREAFIYDQVKNHPELKQKWESQGLDFTSPAVLGGLIEQKAVDEASSKQEHLAETQRKQLASGVFGEFSGDMVGFMSDPTDLASLAIGVSSGVGVIRTIAEMAAVNVGIEILELPQVNAWRERVTGEKLTTDQFLTNIGYIGAGTAILGAATKIPFGRIIGGIEKSINRQFTPKETLEAMNILESAAAEKYNYQHTPSKDLTQIENKQDADLILEENNLLEGDVGDIKHNDKIKRTLNAMLRDDANSLPNMQTVQVKTPDDIYFLEKHAGYTDEVNLDTLIIDEATYQVKTDVPGIKGDLDPALAGNILVLERADGSRVLLDGHQRVKAAKEQGVKLRATVLREVDGVTPEIGRLASISKNFLEGSIDIASPIIKKIPGMADLLSKIDPMLVAQNAIKRLTPRAMNAIYRNIVSPEAGVLVANAVDGEASQLAMMHLIRESGAKTDADIEKLINETIANKTLDNILPEDLPDAFRGLFVDNERSLIIDEVIAGLEQENLILKTADNELANGAGKGSEQATLINARRIENERTIELIKEYGAYDGEISDEFTRGAYDYLNGGSTDITGISNRTRESIRKSVSEGRYDGLQGNGGINASNFRTKINNLSTAFKSANQDLMQYVEGAVSKGVANDNDSIVSVLNASLENNPGLVSKVVSYDVNGNPITLQRILDDVSEYDKHIDFIKRCGS